MKISNLSACLIPQIAEIERSCFSQPRSEQALFEELADKNTNYFIAEEDGIVMGYVGIRATCGEVYISNIAVAHNFRRQGIAEFLIDRLIKYYTSANFDFIVLDVRKSNRAAINLYEKCGFINRGERKNFYDLPKEDAYVYSLDLLS